MPYRYKFTAAILRFCDVYPERSSAWLEHLVWDQGVACSNHVAPTYKALQLIAGLFYLSSLMRITILPLARPCSR